MLSLKGGEYHDRPLYQFLGNALFVEQIASHDQEVRLTFVGGSHQSLKRGESLFEKAISDAVRVFGEGKADVIVGGLKDSKAHNTDG